MPIPIANLTKTILLWSLAMAYQIVISIRNLLYDSGLLRASEAGVPVVSVGNLVAGGTGKTPFAIALAGMLLRNGKRVAIVSRGYRRQAKSDGPLVVSDGREIRCPMAEAGDEPYLMAARLLARDGPGAMVIVCADRVKAAEKAKELRADVIVLDDGFQHRRLRRNVDLVLMDAARPLDNGWMLPAGMLREPPRSLVRASAVIATRCGSKPLPPLFHEIQARGIKVYQTQHRPGQPYRLQDLGNANPPPAALPVEGPALLFSGIANPDSFEDSIRELGLTIGQHLRYRDHHNYSEQDLARIASAGRDYQAVITTEKDAVRLPPGWDPGCPALVLPVEIQFPTQAEAAEFEQFILRKIGR